MHTKVFFIVDNGWPTHQPDVAALFGIFLARLGLRTDIIAHRNPGQAEWPAGSAHLAARAGGRMRAQAGNFLHDAHCLWRLKKGDCDAIQVRNKVFVSVIALWKARALGVPFFYWMSYPMTEAAIRLAREQRRSVGLLRWLYLVARGYGGRAVLHRIVLPWATHIFVQSDRMRDDMASRGVPHSRMSPVPMGIDPARFVTPSRAAPPPLPPGRRIIGYLGTCARVRRIDFLFEVVRRLRTAYPDILLLLVGDAEEAQDKAWLRSRIAELGVHDQVMITGWLAPEAAQACIAAAEVALALMAPDPLLDSTTPTKLVEYLAMGKPVVANDHPDQRQVIAESGAGLCVAFDPTAFADAVALLLADPERRAQAARLGPSYVCSKRSYQTIAAALHASYASFISAAA